MGELHEYFFGTGFASLRPEVFYHRCFDYLGRQFISKWVSMTAECVLAMVGKTSIVVKLIGVAV